jgi:hypothetical protein
MFIKRIGPPILCLVGMTSMAAKAGAPSISLMRDSGGSDRIDPITQQLRRGLRWSHGAYFFADQSTGDPPIFYTLNREGSLVASPRFEYSGEGSFYVTSSDRMSNGTLVFAGMTAPRSSRRDLSPFLAWISAAGHDQHKVSTGRYLPYLLAVAPDDTIWTLGYEADTTSENWRLDENTKVLGHFDQRGALLQAAFSLSDFKPFQQSLRMQRGLLATSKDKLGWYGPVADGNVVCVEISLQDFAVTTYPGASQHADKLDIPMKPAITDSGTASVWIQTHTPDSPGTYIFDSSSRDWVPIEVPRLGGFAFSPHLIGVEKDDLIFQYAQESTLLRVQR